MTNSEIQSLVSTWGLEVEFSEEESQFINLQVPRENLHNLMTQLKDHQEMAMDFLFCLTGVDYPNHLTVVYHLESTVHRHMLVVKCNTENREEAVLDTISDIFPTATFHEREVYDLLGINFTNHPNMKRIFLDDSWEGYPLRKDYIDEVNIIIK